MSSDRLVLSVSLFRYPTEPHITIRRSLAENMENGVTYTWYSCLFLRVSVHVTRGGPLLRMDKVLSLSTRPGGCSSLLVLAKDDREEERNSSDDSNTVEQVTRRSLEIHLRTSEVRGQQGSS